MKNKLGVARFQMIAQGVYPGLADNGLRLVGNFTIVLFDKSNRDILQIYLAPITTSVPPHVACLHVHLS